MCITKSNKTRKGHENPTQEPQLSPKVEEKVVNCNHSSSYAKAFLKYF